MDYVTDKIGEGTWTLYLYECPNCHCTRSLDKTKLATMAAMAVVGTGSSVVFGAPIAGWFGALGLSKFAVSGTISPMMASIFIRLNYKVLVEMGKRKIFTCPYCGNTDLVDVAAVSVGVAAAAITFRSDIAQRTTELRERAKKTTEDIRDSLKLKGSLYGIKALSVANNIQYGIKKWWRGI